MRGVVPIFIVILGLSALEYADRQIPGGLEYADAAAIATLFQERAVAGLELAFPSWSDRHQSRSVRPARTRHHRHVEHLRQSEIVRKRIRVGNEGVRIIRRQQATKRREIARSRARMRSERQRDQIFDTDHPVEVTFVVPAEREDMFEAQRKRRGTRRNR